MSLPSCQPKYAKIQELQATANQIQSQLDALQAEIDALESATHNHDGTYSPTSHTHPYFGTEVNPGFVMLRGTVGTQSIADNTVTTVQLQTVVAGNGNFYNTDYPYRILGSANHLYLVVGQVRFLPADIDNPQLYILDADGTAAYSIPKINDAGTNLSMQITAIARGNGGSNQGIQLRVIHQSGGSRDIALDNRTWLTALLITQD